MIKKVITDYTLCYPDPLILKVGEQIKVFEEDTNGKWKGWHACEDSNGKKSWISETYFKQIGDIFEIIKDYNSTELTVKKDESIDLIFEDRGWAWCRNSNNKEGWVPTEVLLPEFIRNCEELRTDNSFSYPGDTETFGTGAALGRSLGLKRVAINYEVLAPGDRSSWPHAHSEEEEFIFILDGTPQIWIDGDVYDLKTGDCVGLPPGTGHAHTLINNSEKEVKALVVGEGDVLNDKIFYPKHPKRNKECEEKGFFWDNHPVNAQGTHDGWPDKKRPFK